MTTRPREATWVGVDAAGGERHISAPEAHPDRPFEGMQWGRVEAPHAPSCQLVVASLTDCAGLDSARPGAEPYRWSELQGLAVAHVAVLHCVDDDVDPTAVLVPIEEERNPFTKEVFRRTAYHRSLESFEVVVDGTLISAKEAGERAMDGELLEAVVLRLPPAFVTRMARMSQATIADMGSRWAHAWSTLSERDRRGSPALSEEDARRGLDTLVAAAKMAVADKHDLFLWVA